jgi:hypothetical protein
MFLTGCSRSLIEPVEAYMMNKTTPPEDKFGEIERGLDPSLRGDDLQEKLTSMARLLPAQQLTSAKVIGYGVVDDADSSSTITTIVEYEFPHEWLLATLLKQDHAGTIMVIGFYINPIPDSVENQNRFTLIGKDPVQYAFDAGPRDARKQLPKSEVRESYATNKLTLIEARRQRCRQARYPRYTKVHEVKDGLERSSRMLKLQH